MPRPPRRAAPVRLELVVGVLGLLAALFVGVDLWLTQQTFDRNHRLDEIPERVAIALEEARFWADESLSAEASVDVRAEILSPLAAAHAGCVEGIQLAPDEPSRRAFAELCGGIEHLQVDLADRLLAARLPQTEEDETAAEVSVGMAVERVLSTAEEADETVEATVDRSNSRSLRLSVASLVVLVVLVGVLVAVVRRRTRRERERIAELEEGRSRLEEAQRLAAVGSFELDLATGESTWSKEMYRIHGVEPEAFEPSFENVLAFVHPDDVEQDAGDVEGAIRAGEAWDYEYRIVRADGEVRWLHARGRGDPPGSEEPMRVVGTLQDVTERRRSMDALQRGMEQQTRAAGRLRALDEMKDAVLTAVSHHVRTPLTAIIGYSAILAERELSEDQRRDMGRRVAKNAERLRGLLEELIDVDRLGREFVEVHRAPTDVAALVREEADAYAERRPVDVEGESVTAEVDEEAVRRAVRSLLENADRFSPSGAPVRVGVEAVGDGGALLCVDDAGPGVPRELRETIFEPFEQGPGVEQHSPGLGVGLSVVARVAKLHGGRAWVEDGPGGGASFRMELAPDGRRAPESVDRIRRLLEIGRRHLEMDVAFVSRTTETAERFLYVEGPGDFPGIEPGASIPIEETYCRRMLDGRIPNAVPDAEALPEVVELRVTREAGIGSYVGVPVTLHDGTVYGALCCLAKGPSEGVGERDVAFLRMLGELVAVELDPEA